MVPLCAVATSCAIAQPKPGPDVALRDHRRGQTVGELVISVLVRTRDPESRTSDRNTRLCFETLDPSIDVSSAGAYLQRGIVDEVAKRFAARPDRPV